MRASRTNDFNVRSVKYKNLIGAYDVLCGDSQLAWRSRVRVCLRNRGMK